LGYGFGLKLWVTGLG